MQKACRAGSEPNANLHFREILTSVCLATRVNRATPQVISAPRLLARRSSPVSCPVAAARDRALPDVARLPQHGALVAMAQEIDFPTPKGVLARSPALSKVCTRPWSSYCAPAF